VTTLDITTPDPALSVLCPSPTEFLSERKLAAAIPGPQREVTPQERAAALAEFAAKRVGAK